MKDNIKTPKTNSQRDDFETQWKRWQQREGQAEEPVPDDQTFMHWVEVAQQTTAGAEKEVVRFPLHRKKRWIPYAAAASIVIAVAIIGLSRSGHPDNGFPAAQEVIVESQTIHFLCNNGCSAQDIMILAGRVIK